MPLSVPKSGVETRIWYSEVWWWTYGVGVRGWWRPRFCSGNSPACDLEVAVMLVEDSPQVARPCRLLLHAGLKEFCLLPQLFGD